MNVSPLADQVGEQIIAIVARQTHVEPASLVPEATLKDLGISSLDAIELIFELEEHFDIHFPDEGANFESDSVGHLISAVHAALAARPGNAGATV
ncbi:acyl carrier protein [Luteibacter sp. Lutesp34]|uniref:acyl carrier protein n=1 Tax=Luteibacter sp. Lutesp34 TaxID=3243030 RepID=UPI0039B40DC3